jgi:hypothetical protein
MSSTHQIRVVAMDAPIPTVKEQEVFPYCNGQSVGHFDGDTLVLYTVGFNEKRSSMPPARRIPTR